MLWKKFNDQIGLIILFLIAMIWIADVVLRVVFTKPVGFAEGVMGATISIFTLIVQYYFRQRPPEDQNTNGGAKT